MKIKEEMNVMAINNNIEIYEKAINMKAMENNIMWRKRKIIIKQ